MKSINNLPNELLLKIFGKVSWEYQIENSLNVICKRWNDLIKRHGIDFDTDYNTVLYVEIICEIEKYFNHTVIKLYIKNINSLEKLLYKFPGYELEIMDSFNIYSPKLTFYNKHLRRLRIVSKRFYYTPIKPYFVEVYKIRIPKITYKFTHLKEITFRNLEIKPDIFEIINFYQKLEIIIFHGCRFSWIHENKISDIFPIFNKQEKVQITFQLCRFNGTGKIRVNLFFILSHGKKIQK
jgi:hypothetical protein